MNKCVFGLSKGEKRDIVFGSFIIAACLILLLFYGCKKSVVPPKNDNQIYWVTIKDCPFPTAQFADSIVYDEKRQVYKLYKKDRKLPSQIHGGKFKVKIDVVDKIN